MWKIPTVIVENSLQSCQMLLCVLWRMQDEDNYVFLEHRGYGPFWNSHLSSSLPCLRLTWSPSVLCCYIQGIIQDSTQSKLCDFSRTGFEDLSLCQDLLTPFDCRLHLSSLGPSSWFSVIMASCPHLFRMHSHIVLVWGNTQALSAPSWLSFCILLARRSKMCQRGVHTTSNSTRISELYSGPLSHPGTLAAISVLHLITCKWDTIFLFL